MDTTVQKFFEADLTLFAVPLYVLAVLLEMRWSRQQGLGLYRSADTKASLAMGLLALLVELLPRMLAIVVMVKLYEISPLRDVVQHQWWAWVLLFFLDDFSYYWFHRSNHEIRLFWAGHVNHHSSRSLNYATALRQGVGERLHKFLFWLWLPLLGFDPAMIITMISINLFYQFWIHTTAIDRLPNWFETIFNTPSHHRVHHASNVRYLDRNHGGVLIIWDRLFGTFSQEVAEEPVVFGLTSNLESDDIRTVALHEYRMMWRDVRRAEHWCHKWRYLLLAPGWSHDGPDKRANSLRRRVAKPAAT